MEGRMSAYDSDPRVEQVDECQYTVDVGGDRWCVSVWTSATEWTATPYIGSKLMRAANLRSREEAEVWMRAVERGPFRSADEAIRALIGDPR
jgi:hypothetical protein